jgi:hypothetical protein
MIRYGQCAQMLMQPEEWTPRVRISGILAWQALGVPAGTEHMTAERLAGLVGQVITFAPLDGSERYVYRLTAWHEDGQWFDAEWPD